jgi:hypothetical protein
MLLGEGSNDFSVLYVDFIVGISYLLEKYR